MLIKSEFSEQEDIIEATKFRCKINVKQCRYDIVSKVAKKVLNWKLRYFVEDQDGAIIDGQKNQKLSPHYDLTWHDLPISVDLFSKLLPYQKVNMYPGIQCIAKKHNLAKNLMRMHKKFQNDYNFFPKTFVLPSQQVELRNDFAHSQKKVTYIVKPDSLSQGAGIFLSKNVDSIIERIEEQDQGYVVQQYIDKPHLIDGLKYDLRLYVFLYGVNPLRIYLHQLAFARFCTEDYEQPSKSNMDNIYMHLTNYALNKLSENYQENEDPDGDEGHKKSLGAVLRILQREGCNTTQLMAAIKDLIVKTIITGQPILNHEYKLGQPECLDNSMAFQILGFDVLIDSKYNPWLLEVNASPSFRTDSNIDYVIKKAVIGDALTMLNFTSEKKKQVIREAENKKEERLRTGKTIKFTKVQQEERRQQQLEQRFRFESQNLRGYELIYPSSSSSYEVFIAESQMLWDEFFVGKKQRTLKQVSSAEVGKEPLKPIKVQKRGTTNTLQPLVISPQIFSKNYNLESHKTRKSCHNEITNHNISVVDLSYELTPTQMKLKHFIGSANQMQSTSGINKMTPKGVNSESASKRFTPITIVPPPLKLPQVTQVPKQCVFKFDQLKSQQPKTKFPVLTIKSPKIPQIHFKGKPQNQLQKSQNLSQVLGLQELNQKNEYEQVRQIARHQVNQTFQKIVDEQQQWQNKLNFDKKALVGFFLSLSEQKM